MNAKTLPEAAKFAQDFSRRFDGINVHVYECRVAGTYRVIGYILFLGQLEPENAEGHVFTLVGTLKAGRSVN